MNLQEIPDYGNGTVYLIHLDQPIHPNRTTQHYLGFSRNLDGRIEAHQTGRGAKLLKAANDRGIPWDVVKVWERATFALEVSIKCDKNHHRICPICREAYLERRREWDRTRRKPRSRK